MFETWRIDLASPSLLDPIPARNAHAVLQPDILPTHQAGDCASTHDRGSGVHKSHLFPTRASDVGVPVIAPGLLPGIKTRRIHRCLRCAQGGVRAHLLLVEPDTHLHRSLLRLDLTHP